MIAIRTDSSNTIGTGHVFRCLHLAELLRKLGKDVHFVCRNLPGNVGSIIEGKRFTLNRIDTEQEGVAWLNANRPNWIVVDHYGLDRNWEENFYENSKLFVIDDLGNRPHLCHVLLDQNYRQDYSLYQGKVPEDCRVLLGPGYCLLEGKLAKSDAVKIFGRPPRILCFFGGADATGELMKLAENIKYSDQFQFELVCVSSHLFLDQLKKIQLPSNARLHIDTPLWQTLLTNSDFYIGSGGSVTWERYYLGLPGAVITVAENQVIPTQDLARNKFQYYWGSHQSFDYTTVETRLVGLFKDTSALSEMSQRAKNLVRKFDPSLVKEIFC